MSIPYPPGTLAAARKATTEYTVKHTVSTGPFSKIEFESTGTMEELIKQAHWLREQFKSIPKHEI